MCGIAGFIFNKKNINNTFKEKILNQLCDDMVRRGPDNKGLWISKNKNVGLGHNRLSIIDLNQRSNQPMCSKDNNYIISFNGEIYNYKELKTYLHKFNVKFNTKSDTEVILKLYELKGPKMLNMLRGMFSIAIWDQKKEIFFLARDPYGIKPLYIGKLKEGFIFSSQVKPILNTKLITKEINYEGILSFFLFGNIIEPNTCFKNIINLKSGNYCTISKNNEIKFYEYVNIKNYFSKSSNIKLSNDTINKKIKFSIIKSIKKHTTSDVPIAVMLSGGIDSSSLVYHLIDLNIKFIAITVVFDEYANTDLDELPFAKEIIKGKQIRHYVRKVSKKEFLNDIDEIIDAMDQPTIDGINTWYACKAASEKNIKVLLSGVGGDELFFGYPSFRQIPKLLTCVGMLKKIPFGIKMLTLIESILYKSTKNHKWKYLKSFGSNIYTAFWLRRGMLTPFEINQKFKASKKINNFSYIENFIKNKIGPVSKNKRLAVAQLENFFYLRNQLLRDSDWASMYHSVELRTPFVDYFLLNDLKSYMPYLSKFSGKEPLAASSKTKLPISILKRKKTGFNIPVKNWMKEFLQKKHCMKNKVDSVNYIDLIEYVIKNIYNKSNISLG